MGLDFLWLVDLFVLSMYFSSSNKSDKLSKRLFCHNSKRLNFNNKGRRLKCNNLVINLELFFTIS